MPLCTTWLKWAALRLIVALVAAVPLAASAGAAAPADEPLYRTYLPVVLRLQPGIQGRITHGGAPAVSILVELRFFDGSSYSSAGFVTTDGAGVYLFGSAASLGPGQSYYVRYENSSQGDTYLHAWYTRDLTGYTVGDSAYIGNFDLANFSHTAPPAGATVPLPQDFSWAFRPATPADSFDFNLFDADDSDPFFWTNPPLGHVNGYTLQSLPGGFSTDTLYGWYPGVYSPDGGYGVPYYFYWVMFSSAGQAAGDGAARQGMAAFAESELGEATLAQREAGR
jgi:hypothetical protein